MDFDECFAPRGIDASRFLSPSLLYVFRIYLPNEKAWHDTYGVLGMILALYDVIQLQTPDGVSSRRLRFCSCSCLRLCCVPGGQPGSSETALIQAEYAAVDAREKAKAEAEVSRRLRGPLRVRLAPSTAALRMPSEG